MTDQHLRMSDAERDQAATALGEHYAQGRLTADEHGERLDRILAARTRGELGPVFADLPAPGGSRRRRGMPAPLVVLLAVLVTVTVVSHLPIILVGLLVWFLLSRRGHCSPRPLRHSARHR